MGDAAVALVAGNGTRVAVPGEVPVGVYNIEATFPGAAPVLAGKVKVTPAGVTIKCNPKMGICRPQ
ncbi:MAG: hypothetical protein KC621_25680 [Myxococcales bacterium]|nr:hypothetical protein [Myxococcales bacterium]